MAFKKSINAYSSTASGKNNQSDNAKSGKAQPGKATPYAHQMNQKRAPHDMPTKAEPLKPSSLNKEHASTLPRKPSSLNKERASTLPRKPSSLKPTALRKESASSLNTTHTSTLSREHLLRFRDGLTISLSLFSCAVFVGGHLYFFGGVTGPFIIACVFGYVFSIPVTRLSGWISGWLRKSLKKRNNTSMLKNDFSTESSPDLSTDDMLSDGSSPVLWERRIRAFLSFCFTLFLCAVLILFFLHLVPFLQHHLDHLGTHVMHHTHFIFKKMHFILRFFGDNAYTPAALQHALNGIGVWVSSTLHHTVHSSSSLEIGLLYTTATPLLTFILLRDWGTLTRTTHHFLAHKAHPAIKDIVCYLSDLSHNVFIHHFQKSAWFALFHIIAFWIFHVPYALTLGTLHGMLLMIPYVGFGLSFLISIVVLLQSEIQPHVLWVTLLVFAASAVLSYIFTRRYRKNAVSIPPMVQVIMLLVSALLLGPLGLFLTLPLAAFVTTLGRYALNFLPASPIKTALPSNT